MVKVLLPNGEIVSYDSLLHKLGLLIKNKINSDDTEFLVLVTGKEGEGKSLFAQRLAYIVDELFCLDQIAMTQEKFVECIKTCRKKAIVIDETGNFMHSKSTMSKKSVRMQQLLDQTRQTRNCLIFVIPNAMNMDVYLREKFMNQDGGGRMIFEVFSYQDKRGLNFKGNARVYPNISGNAEAQFATRLMIHYMRKRKGDLSPKPRCMKYIKGNVYHENTIAWSPVDQTQYRELKAKVLNDAIEEIAKPNEKTLSERSTKLWERDRNVRDKSITIFYKLGMSMQQIADNLGVAKTTVAEAIEAYKDSPIEINFAETFVRVPQSSSKSGIENEKKFPSDLGKDLINRRKAKAQAENI